MLREAMELLRDVLSVRATPIESDLRARRSEYILAPNGYQLTPIPEKREIPTTLKQTVQFDELASFAAYLSRYGTEEGTVIFVEQDSTSMKMSGVLDYHRNVTSEDAVYDLPPHTAVLPQWGSHVAHCAPVLTPEWELWVKNNEIQMEQIDFARFLEENRLDIDQPLAGDLIQVCRELTVLKSVNYQKAERDLDGNVTLSYREENKPNGKIEIPSSIKLRMSIFRSEPSVEVEANLRFRLHSGACYFSYSLVRPHKAMEDAVLEMRKQIVTLTENRFAVFSGRRAAAN